MTSYHPVDVHVGKRLRQRRALLGMSQTILGKSVGLTFQQIQKYERGINRLGASRLYEFARVLDVPVSYFFDELSAADGRTPSRSRGKAVAYAPPSDRGNDPMAKRETLEFVRAYFKIRKPATRQKIVSLLKALG